MNKEAYIQGAGRLQFTTISPAGTGRKVYIPFYLENVTTGYQVMTPTGLATTSTQQPTIRLAAPAANGSTVTATLRTPQIPYAALRFVGFVTKINTPAIPSTSVMDISFSDFEVWWGNQFVCTRGFWFGSALSNWQCKSWISLLSRYYFSKSNGSFCPRYGVNNQCSDWF